MKRINRSIIPNEHVSGPKQSIVIDFFDQIFNQIFKHSDNELSHLKNKEYVYALMEYGTVTTETSIFDYVLPRSLKRVQTGNAFFVYDASNEGHVPNGWFPIFDVLLADCKKYSVNPKQVIYVTGNHRDPENMAQFCKLHKVDPFHIVAINAFETAMGSETYSEHRPVATKGLRTAIRMCNAKFDDKLFSSLSRINRIYRTLGQFLLSQSPASSDALISHNVIDETEIPVLQYLASKAGIDKATVAEWINTLPLTIDYTDFSANWAVEHEHRHIYDQTIFQLVNETLTDDHNNTSMFYSEKTFRPIVYFQPFVIWGQKGCNHKLQDFGYKLYDDWFDLSFDWEDDDVVRYQKLLASVEQACEYLRSLSREEQIQWRFKNKQKLIHNYNVAVSSAHNINTLYEFFKRLRT